jgi:predicted nucleic acid-binding protein
MSLRELKAVIDADENLSVRLHSVLDRGEAEALSLALERNIPVVLDDKRANKLAREL